MTQDTKILALVDAALVCFLQKTHAYTIAEKLLRTENIGSSIPLHHQIEEEKNKAWRKRRREKKKEEKNILHASTIKKLELH